MTLSAALTTVVWVAQLFPGGHIRGTRVLIGCAGVALLFALETEAAPSATADPPYQSCDQARADGRWSIPYTDPAYQPELDFDGDGLACEPGKGHRSRR